MRIGRFGLGGRSLTGGPGPRRARLAIIACLLLVPPEALSQGTELTVIPKAEAAGNVRAKVRAGELHVCVSETVTDLDSQPVIAFQNHCQRQVNVMLCVQVPAQPTAYYLILIERNARVRHRLWSTDGKAFNYTYNACDRPYCTPPRSEC
jgi:hypothetical protein